ncbi:HTH-type transcriptional regulator TdfR [Variovorax boronicumulans]|uniref:LysR family transcriptional regulator n=1 Tax=Variovorax boronicumulans TaxID=436515 RepID=UPI00209BEEAD|nr:LysR family transcriptional regulator [Variovorax boronicumulans]PBI88722.1 HTH-type transcriptional regulator TdfR [Variovorax boronicumulans]
MLRITFRQLEAFHWAATLGSVNAAARHLFVSQPAITARVRELEGILGHALFARSQQGVQLTVAGDELFQQVQQLLKAGEEVERRGGRLVPPLAAGLRLGIDESQHL